MAKRSHGGVGAGATAGLAAVGAAAAAGYYFYASDNAKKHRKQAAKWANSFKKEALREVRALQKVDARSVARAVDTAAATYATVRSVDREDLARAAKELKANWQRIQAEATRTGKGAMKRAKSTAKKAVKKGKKAVKKAVKKSAKKSR
ncbi:MAG TPA: hypothetical protein VHB93_00185 [Candidatus Paceibacterota bacterium]|nr:hypothetical protein [Candidatus Paceibacterota bacterium]